MKQNKKSTRRGLGWILLLLGVGMICLQVSTFFIQNVYHMSYIDERLFYIIQIVSVLLVGISLSLLIQLSKIGRIIIFSIAFVLIMIEIGLMIEKNNQIHQITSISPNLKHVFSVKEDLQSNEAIYYRSYYYILGRPHTKLAHPLKGESNIEWLADDIVVFTYEAEDNTIQQYVGTYGDRKQGLSYYYVGAEIQGEWGAEGVEVESTPDGIIIKENNQEERFTWEDMEQFGTLAIVLKNHSEAVWTIALAESFVVDQVGEERQKDEIILYEAKINKATPKKLKRIN